ncbi:hypothetical protein [Bradyrhizobium sp.]|uniref:hypothetical protein n=1 Tax=Bradyrhizobium sp. TaxID=376 RepID=UPI0039E46D99
MQTMTRDARIDFDDVSHDPINIVRYRKSDIAAKAHIVFPVTRFEAITDRDS